MLRRHAAEVGPDLVDNVLMEAAAPQQNGTATEAPTVPSPGALSSRVRPLRDIAERTEGYSGSDLAELCSQAAAIPVHEYIGAMERYEAGRGTPQPQLEPLSKHHFEQVLAHMVPPSRAAQAVQSRRRGRRGINGGPVGLIAEQDVNALAAAISAALARGLRVPFAEHPIGEGQ
jgi:hypothetical protein